MKPQPMPETAPYWEGARAGELRTQRCLDCGRHYFYPRVACRHCASEHVEWVAVSGRGRLVSYVIDQRPISGMAGASAVIALVELDEGPRLLTNIVGVDPDPRKLPLDLRVQVCFEDDLPVFRPTEVAE